MKIFLNFKGKISKNANDGIFENSAKFLKKFGNSGEMFIIERNFEKIMENIDTEHYFNTADEFISLANTHLQNSTAPRISNIMMYATARFNVYNFASQSENKEIFEKEKSENIEFLVEAYKKSLEEHYADYIENFDEYLERN